MEYLKTLYLHVPHQGQHQNVHFRMPMPFVLLILRQTGPPFLDNLNSLSN